jgi:hypothetical protein
VIGFSPNDAPETLLRCLCDLTDIHHSKVEKRATKAYAGGKAVTGVVRDADIDLQLTIQLRIRDVLHLRWFVLAIEFALMSLAVDAVFGIQRGARHRVGLVQPQFRCVGWVESLNCALTRIAPSEISA